MSAEDIKRLREVTGAGVMDAKKALDDAGNDFDKAMQIIKERGFTKAEKKAERVTSAGLIISYVHGDKIGVLLELKCETDFVARLEDFKALGKDIALQITAMNPQNVEELMAQQFIKSENETIEGLVTGMIAKTGENIQIGRFCRYAL